MSQWGANGLAGQGYYYTDILATYYNEIELKDITYYYEPLYNYVDILKQGN